MSDREEIGQAVQEILREILPVYDELVPARSTFPDVRAGRKVHFGDPEITMPGRIELAVMHMDAELDRTFDSLRFLAVRVWKSRDGGIASTTCFHGAKKELKQELLRQADDPEFLIDRVQELADGLPEETNPDIWR
jgi:hypothetical protein